MNHLRLYKIIRGIFIGFIALIALLLVVSLFLPDQRVASSRYRILSKSDKLYSYVADLRQWHKWNYWLKTGDPTLKARVAGEDTSKKQTLVWYSDNSGNGSITITGKKLNEFVKYEIFIDDNMFFVSGCLTFSDDERGSVITWTEKYVPDNRIFGKYALLLINVLAPQDHDRSIKFLEQLADASSLASKRDL